MDAIVQPGRPESTLERTEDVKQQISDWLYDRTGGIVMSGPFEGMKLMRETSWTPNIAPMLLGCYEEELHGEFERQIRRLTRKGFFPDPKISVIGSAEGYYAVGLKRRIPNAQVFIVDKDPEAMRICEQAAVANQTQLTINAPMEVYMDVDLIVMDVEGSEIAYLNPDKFPCLLGAHMIVEIHDFTDHVTGERVSEMLLSRFRGSHHITLIMEGQRNPNRYLPLGHMTSDYRWLAVSEGRPTMMGWYVMEPKGSYVP